MADIITKILIRKGTDEERRTAEGTGVVFSSGEPGFCVNTKRLFIGDGSHPGGWPIGIQNLGTVNKLFDNYQNGFSFAAIGLFNNKGACVGDLIYDRDTRGIYSLSSVTEFPPLTSDVVKFDTATLVNTTQFLYDENARLNIRNGGVNREQLNIAVVDGITLFKPTYNAPISIKTGCIDNTYLAKMPSNTLKVNSDIVLNQPTDLQVLPGHVVGRTYTSQLTSFSFDEILSLATFNSSNGIIIDQSVAPPIFKLDENLFNIAPIQIGLRKDTVVSGKLTVNGDVSITGTLRCNNDVVAYYMTPSDRAFKENLIPIESPVEKILAITGYGFNWKKGNPYETILNGHDYGVVAQDVEKVIPEAVVTKEDGTKSVSYIKLIPFLIESIKALNARISALEASK